MRKCLLTWDEANRTRTALKIRKDGIRRIFVDIPFIFFRFVKKKLKGWNTLLCSQVLWSLVSPFKGRKQTQAFLKSRCYREYIYQAGDSEEQTEKFAKLGASWLVLFLINCYWSKVNLLKTKSNLLYIINQPVQRSKLFPPQLQKPIS